MNDVTSLAVVDVDALNELKDLAGEECKGIYQEFFDEFITQCADMQTAFGNNDVSGLKSLSHSIKGASASLGLLQLSHQASLIEEKAKEGVATEPSALIESGKETQEKAMALLA